MHDDLSSTVHVSHRALISLLKRRTTFFSYPEELTISGIFFTLSLKVQFIIKRDIILCPQKLFSVSFFIFSDDLIRWSSLVN